MPIARLERARKSLPSDYVYEPPSAARTSISWLAWLVAGEAPLCATPEAADKHPADAEMEPEGYGLV